MADAQPNPYSLPKRCAAEFVGTFFLVLTIGLAVRPPLPLGALTPIPIAAILIAMIYACAHISGAHFNPAATLGLILRRACPTQHLAPYIATQVVAAIAAAALCNFIKPIAPESPLTPDPLPALALEFLFTFALVFVILHTATIRDTPANNFFGLAIGLVVLAGALVAGSTSGAAFNPAVAIALAMLGIVNPASLWIYALACFSAAATAAAIFRWLEPREP